MPFEPIETQEQFDAAIADRLERERKKFSDYDTLKSSVQTLTAQVTAKDTEINNYKTQIKEQKTQIAKYETDSVKTRIANEEGLSLELVNRLTGDTEDAIRADAKTLAGLLQGTGHNTAPLATPERTPDDVKHAAYKNLIKGL